MKRKEFKSGFVSIVGRPNVGKSTLLNQILQTKVAIVTPKAQTTRNKIQGIYTTSCEQIIFVDTPGIHNSFNELGTVMNQLAYEAIEGMDLILFLVDSNMPFSDLDREIIEKLKKVNTPIILVFNKIDLIKDEEKFDKLFEEYKVLKCEKIVKISAEQDLGISELVKSIIEILPVGPQYYPEDQLMDQPERFMVAEIIREKILLSTQQEVPHSVAVEIESFKNDIDNPNLININATIVVERLSQKKIIIGDKGGKIKSIGMAARKDIAKFLGNKVYLELFVKVEADWRNRKHYLKQYGYQANKN
ncbi:MAG: GTPase Era [Bacilli bacterium]|nr:GTPase Era [Bacilli bacterium]